MFVVLLPLPVVPTLWIWYLAFGFGFESDFTGYVSPLTEPLHPSIFAAFAGYDIPPTGLHINGMFWKDTFHWVSSDGSPQ
jgi:hypothetical protein